MLELPSTLEGGASSLKSERAFSFCLGCEKNAVP
jgi:hypothetical protein